MMKFDKVMMECAISWSKMSYCKRKKVGAVLSTADGRIICTGYNGTISKAKNLCEKTYIMYNNRKYTKKQLLKKIKIIDKNKYGVISINNTIIANINTLSYDKIIKGLIKYNEIDIVYETSEYTLHAEQNILLFCAKNGINTNNTTMYITLSPCKTCAKLLIQAGIKRVVYLEKYRDISGINFLKENGIIVNQMDSFN